MIANFMFGMGAILGLLTGWLIWKPKPYPGMNELILQTMDRMRAAGVRFPEDD